MVSTLTALQKCDNFFEDSAGSLNNVTGDAPPPNIDREQGNESGFLPLSDFGFSSDSESAKRDLLPEFCI